MRLNWKQPTPVMQLTAIRASIEGHFSNWCDGIISTKKFRERMDFFLEELSELEPYLEKGEWTSP
jgi:hypothetical protein